jgi:murein DD-endopeptidase MepM/ murein hydrolase activator NlpD
MSVGALEKEIDAIPVRRPTAGEADITSSFGVRLDPFLRQPAMHTGIDFRGDAGDPVHATAAGRVVQAERNGGYGQMVEIDHGNGLVTRYAHLSAIAVSNGAAVAPGDLIGRIGSTGRSTGPHLHYEIRMQGEASDPQRFLRAGLRLDARN